MTRDSADIVRALRDILPASATVTNVSPLTTGFSNETYRIDGPDLILRLPPAAGAMLDGHDVVAQARIYAALAKAEGAPPVPRIVAIEEGGRLGVPFFVMERVAGESIHDLDLPRWLVDGLDGLREQVCRDWLTVFSRLANLPPLTVLGATVSPEADARQWRAFAAAAGCARLVALFDRLLVAPAPSSGPPAVVHGDPKLSNLMWHYGRISGVLDWEMALNGDPLADLAYMLNFFAGEYTSAARAQKLPGMLSEAQAIGLWERITARSAKGLAWHRIAQMGKVAAIIAEGTNMYETGRSTDPKLAQFQKTLDHYIGVMAAMLDGAGL